MNINAIHVTICAKYKKKIDQEIKILLDNARTQYMCYMRSTYKTNFT